MTQARLNKLFTPNSVQNYLLIGNQAHAAKKIPEAKVAYGHAIHAYHGLTDFQKKDDCYTLVALATCYVRLANLNFQKNLNKNVGIFKLVKRYLDKATVIVNQMRRVNDTPELATLSEEISLQNQTLAEYLKPVTFIWRKPSDDYKVELPTTPSSPTSTTNSPRSAKVLERGTLKALKKLPQPKQITEPSVNSSSQKSDSLIVYAFCILFGFFHQENEAHLVGPMPSREAQKKMYRLKL